MSVHNYIFVKEKYIFFGWKKHLNWSYEQLYKRIQTALLNIY